MPAWPHLFHAGPVFWAVVYSSKRREAGENAHWAPLFPRLCSCWHAVNLTAFQLYSTEAPLWVWKLELRRTVLPGTTRVGTSRAEAKLAPALSFLLFYTVFWVRRLPAGLRTPRQEEDICQTPEAASALETDVCVTLSWLPWKTGGVSAKEKW